MKYSAILLLILCLSGCSTPEAVEDRLRVSGDIDPAICLYYIMQGADCQGVAPYLMGRLQTVRWEEPQVYTWTNETRMVQTTLAVSGVVRAWPDGTVTVMCVEDHASLLRALGWHWNRIQKFQDYSSPPRNGWCGQGEGPAFAVIDDMGRQMDYLPPEEITRVQYRKLRALGFDPNRLPVQIYGAEHQRLRAPDRRTPAPYVEP